MNYNYLNRLYELTEDAYQGLRELLKTNPVITLLTQDDIDERESVKTNFYNSPDFPHYDRYNYLEQAAIQQLKMDGDTIYITGVLKGDNFPEKVTITLDELEGHYAIELADYLYNDYEK